MNVSEVIAALYAAGIDSGLESFQGYGITAWVVGERNQRIEKRFRPDELEAVAEWMRQEGSRHGTFERAYEAHTRELLAELDGERRDPKRVEASDRASRRSEASPVDGTHF